MRLLFHQFRKDFRQTWIIWALWFFFVLVQFALAAWTVNPADLAGSGVYGQIIGMVPFFHAILLFVLIPLLVFQEPPVGTTASWLTRPMPPATILGSKLIAFGILVLFPLLGQCVVLMSHHVVFQDVMLAGFQIALKELSWIALATGIAVLCPNFGTFLIAAAALYVLQYSSNWIWSWLNLIHILPRFSESGSSPWLGSSRIVAADLACIVFGLSVVFLQYLTRKTRAAIFLGIAGLLVTGMIMRYWPWDFLNVVSEKAIAAHVPFDASGLRFTPTNHSNSQGSDVRGMATQTTMSLQFSVSGLTPDQNMSLRSDGGELTFPDGKKIQLKTNPNNLNPSLYGGVYDGGGRYGWGGYGDGGGSNVTGVGKAIGDLPILNREIYGGFSFGVSDLFTIDSDTLNQKGTDLGTAVFQLKGEITGYRIVAEIPLKQGEFFFDQSKRTTLTGIFKGDDGVNLTLRERSLNLLLAPSAAGTAVQPVYLLLNRKRGEALWSENNGGNSFYGNGVYVMGEGNALNGLLAAFDLGDNRFEFFTSVNLAFHAQQGDNSPLPVPIDAAWLADAVLVRVEPESKGDFTTKIQIPDFSLDGHTLANGNEDRYEEPDVETLRKIVLPQNPTRSDVWRYITRILYASFLQRSRDNDDPQVVMLAKVGPEHAVDLLIAMSTFRNFEYPLLALKTMDLTKQEDVKKMIFRLLPKQTGLIDLVVANHWEAEAKPMLLARLVNRRPSETIDDAWLNVLTLFSSDPEVKQALLDLLRTQQNVIRIVIEQHWENDAKPILISVISRTKPGSPIDDRWVKVLDSFHDDSNVKATLLRVLPSNPDAIETVVQNHWENDAKPILLETLNNIKRRTSIDDRWFQVLASLPDQSGVKEAVIRVLPFCQNAIITVIQNHWEKDALPVMLDFLTKAKPGQDSINEKWMPALNTVANEPGVKEAVLRILPFCRDAIVVVIQNHWETDAKPILLDKLAKTKPNESFDDRWFTALNTISDQPGVKEAILAAVPVLRGAVASVIQNHWQTEAQPIMLDRLNKAKPGDSFDDRWFQILDSLPDKTGYKEAVFHVLPFVQNVAGTILQNHWEKEAQPIVLDALIKAKPEKTFTNAYIGLAALDPADPVVKEAILRVLPFNNEAIDFVVKNHWEADAKPIMLQKLSSGVFGSQVNQKWIEALASLGDPSIYPLLLSYTENKMNGFRNGNLLDDIRPLPAAMVRPLVERAWNASQGTEYESYALLPVARWGLTDVLDRCIAILSEPDEMDKQKIGRQQALRSRAKETLSAVLPCPDKLLNADLAAWYKARRNQLGFDPGLNRFMLHPKAIPMDQSWPDASDSMRAIGKRIAAGDTKGFAEITDAMERASEGLDPKKDTFRIRVIRGSLANPAFIVLQNEVEKNPGILGIVDTVNRQEDLQRFVVGVYGAAAAAGNAAALDALLHYQTRQWQLVDVVNSLGAAVTKENAGAIAFLGNLSADPNCTTPILNRASNALIATANAGNESARAAYRNVQKALDDSKD